MIRRRKEKNIVNDINLAPLLDMVFILLIFFVVTSSFIERYVVDITLPSASTGEKSENKINTILIDKNGDIYLNSEKTDFKRMKTILDSLNRESFVVSPDKSVSSGQLIEVIDFLRKKNITKIAVSVEDNG